MLIMKGHIFNKFGHGAIITKFSNSKIERIQQNTGTQTKP